jgi:hypothetical protein
MAHKIGDRIKEQASTSGTGAFTLAGALAGFEAFASALTSDADTTWYCAVNDTQWEIGLGTRTAAGVLARTAVINSSNADALVNFTAPPVVFCTVPANTLRGVNGPTFSAKLVSGTQAVAGDTQTKLTGFTEDWDSDDAFDPATSRFTPQVPGYYQVFGSAAFTDAASANHVVTVYKNGVGTLTFMQLASAAYRIGVAGLVYMNGTTDYLELFVYSSGVRTVNGATFQACLARSA